MGQHLHHARFIFAGARCAAVVRERMNRPRRDLEEGSAPSGPRTWPTSKCAKRYQPGCWTPMVQLSFTKGIRPGDLQDH
jgi:hypothetical protein